MEIVAYARCFSFDLPIEPEGKGRPRFARRGKFVKTYTPEQTASFEAKVAYFVSKELLGQKLPIFDGAVRVEAVFVFTRGKSVKRLHHTTKPDVDNVAKAACLDALTGILWADDSQVTELIAKKEYGDSPAIRINVTEIVSGAENKISMKRKS